MNQFESITSPGGEEQLLKKKLETLEDIGTQNLPANLSEQELALETQKFNSIEENEMTKMNEVRKDLGMKETSEPNAEVAAQKRSLDSKIQNAGSKEAAPKQAEKNGDEIFGWKDKKVETVPLPEEKPSLEVGDEIYKEGVFYKVNDITPNAAVEKPILGGFDKNASLHWNFDQNGKLEYLKAVRDEDLISPEWKAELAQEKGIPRREIQAEAVDKKGFLGRMLFGKKEDTKVFTEDAVTKVTEGNQKKLEKGTDTFKL